MSWFQVLIIAVFCFVLMFIVAGALSSAHSNERTACIKAGHTWSATKYVCVANIKK